MTVDHLEGCTSLEVCPDLLCVLVVVAGDLLVEHLVGVVDVRDIPVVVVRTLPRRVGTGLHPGRRRGEGMEA